MSNHDYLMKTNRDYRDRVVAEYILKIAQLVEVLAMRQGLTWDDEGNLVGLKKGEAEKLALFTPEVDRSTVKEARPKQSAPAPVEEDTFDAYGSTPDPEGSWGSEPVSATSKPSETPVEDVEDTSAEPGAADSEEEVEEAGKGDKGK